MNTVVDRARAGDVDAFVQIHDEYRERILRHVQGIVTDPAVAADVAQATWDRAWQRIASTRPGTLHIQAWLYRIATNLALDYVRQRIKRRTVSLEYTVAKGVNAVSGMTPVVGRAGVNADAAEIIEQREYSASIARALSALEPLEYEVLMRRADGQGVRSIARELNLPTRHVVDAFARAQAKARSNISNETC